MKLLTLFLLSLMALAGCSSAPQRPAALVEGERFLALGVKAYRNDEMAQAANFFTKGLTHYQGLDHAEGELQSRINLTEVALAVGNFDAARRHLAQAERLAAGPLSGYRPRLVLLRANLAQAIGEMESARALSETLLPVKLGGTGEVAAADPIVLEALINRTSVAFASNEGAPESWVARLEALADDDAYALARQERFAAQLARRGGDYPRATHHLQRALEHCKTLTSRRCIAATLEEWGGVLQADGDVAGAEDRYMRALAVRLALLDRGGSSKNLKQLADICQASGRGERAALLTGWAEQVASGKTIDWSRLRGESLPR